MNIVLQKLFDPIVHKVRNVGSYIYSILITIPDLTLQGVLFLGFIFFILMLSISQRDPVLFQLAIICYIIFGGCFIFSYINLSGISSTRVTPRFVFAKELFVIKVTIENNKKTIETYWLTLEDDFYKKEHNAFLSCVSIAPQNSLEKEFMTVIHRRGVYREFSYRLISTFPFGFFIKEKIQTENIELTVFPAAMDELELDTLLGVQQGSQGSLQIYNSDYQGEIRGMRPFMPGDPIKSIHWAASIRANQMLVRELEPNSSNKILIIAHCVNPNKKRIRSRKAFEKMLQFLSGYFIHKVKESSECFFCFSFDNYNMQQVTSDYESLYSVLIKLAEAKEQKDLPMSSLINCVSDNQHFNNVIVIGNTSKDFWAPALYQINNQITCVDTTLIEGKV
jgi:hypothetical protein